MKEARWRWCIALFLKDSGTSPQHTAYDVSPGELELFIRQCWEAGARITRIEKTLLNDHGGYTFPPIRAWL